MYHLLVICITIRDTHVFANCDIFFRMTLLHLLTNFCVKMRLIYLVMHEWAHIKGKIVTFQKSQLSHFWGLWNKILANSVSGVCLSAVVVYHPLFDPLIPILTLFMFFSQLGEHNFRENDDYLLCSHNMCWYMLVTISDVNSFNKLNGFCNFRRVEHFPPTIVLTQPWNNMKSVRIGVRGSNDGWSTTTALKYTPETEFTKISFHRPKKKWLVTFEKWQFCL